MVKMIINSTYNTVDVLVFVEWRNGAVACPACLSCLAVLSVDFSLSGLLKF